MQDRIRERLWNRHFILILALGTISSVGFTMVSPIMTKYAVSLGASISFAGIIAGIFSIVALVGRPLSGFFSDRFNKKYLLVAATGRLALASLGYGISTNCATLLFFRILHGVFFTFSSTASMSLGTTYIPKDRLGEGIGYQGLGVILALAIGPNLGIWIMDGFGFSWVFYIAFAFAGISAALMCMLYYPKPEAKEKRAFKFENLISGKAMAFALHGGFFALMNGLIGSFLVNLGDEKQIPGIGVYFLVNSAALLVVRPFSGRLLDRKGLAFIVFPAYALAISAGVFLGAASSLWMVLAAAVLFAAGQGSSQPAIQASCVKKLGPERVGVATSTYFIGADIGMGAGPMLGGAFAGAFGFGALYLCASALLAVGLALFFLYNKRSIREAQEAKPPAAASSASGAVQGDVKNAGYEPGA